MKTLGVIRKRPTQEKLMDGLSTGKINENSRNLLGEGGHDIM